MVDTASDEDVVIRSRRDTAHGATIWPLTRQHGPGAVSVAKMRTVRSRASARSRRPHAVFEPAHRRTGRRPELVQSDLCAPRR